ncbi:MAG: MFS transporter, partial [Proteobacteria bacterium]|nr:MFS transporter [Pseudomonadota bacterium]
MAKPVPTTPPSPSSVYRHAGFMAFLVARLVAVFATQVQAVVVAWQVYELTRAPMALAYVGLAQFLPMLVLLLPAGDLIDRFQRKPILGASWAVGALCSALLWWLAGHEGASGAGVHGIYAVLLLFGCSRAFSSPALSSLLPQIVARGELAQAVAANGMIMRVATIGGPFLGGLLYALGGARLAYAICMACFALGALLLARVTVAHSAPMAPTLGSMWQRFGAGIRFIFSRPIILGTISLDLFAVLLGG